MSALLDIARASADRHGMFPAGSVVLAMVSGGADSTALLTLLAGEALAGDAALFALHVNHGLRGADADADETFVCDLCASLGVPLRVERVDVAAYADENGLNLEDAGRRVRYGLADDELDARCAAAGVSPLRGRIAVAHTRDDRLETFLMRLAQGAGAGGLTTLKPVRDRVVRPLIDAPREQVREHLRVLGRSWREDATNADTSRLRARVRAELLPLMRDINPRFDDALSRTVELLAEEDALLAEMASAFARDFAQVSGGRVAFDCAMMATLSLPMRRRTVRMAVLGEFPESSRLEFDHVESLVAGLAEEGFARDLPGGLRAETRYGTMTVSRAGEGAPAVAPGLLSIPGTVDLGVHGRIVADEVAAGPLSGEPDSTVIDAGKVGCGLTVTGVREGDRMRPLGMRGTKKLSDLLVDAKVPRAERAGVPVVRDGDSIVWVAGLRSSDDYKVDPDTTAHVRLTWVRGAGAGSGLRPDIDQQVDDSPGD